jgi:DNA polymerase-3 subunit gamma/tau
MSYQVLARKWRPATFEALVGQEHVLKALRHALDNERLHHAYLFTGTRGVGKTTIARILAKALNCEQGVSATPCGVCSSCVEISEGRSVDLIEVDAASRTKVEDTRELLDNVQYAPTRSRFKIYLIDEVHMLSGHSFNALLKTLEEPPEHVKFLLATTDPQKLPATVLSRCLQFNLKNLSAQRIVQHLGVVLEEEGVASEEGALWQIGRAAAGSMRDALSLTDQAIAFGNGELKEADVSGMLGSVDRSQVYQLLTAVADDDPKAILAACAVMAEMGVDFALATDELCSVLHRAAIAQTLPEAVDREYGDAERILELAGRLTAEDVQLFFELAQTARGRLAQSSDPRAAFEMLALRLLAFRPVAVLDTALRAEDVVEVAQAGAGEGVPGVKKPEPPRAASTIAKRAPQQAVATQASREAAEPQEYFDPRRSLPRKPGTAEAGGTSATGAVAAELPWHAVLEQLSLTGSARNVASHSILVERGQAEWCLHLDESRASLFNERHEQVLARALSEWHGSTLSVRVTTGRVDQETPAARSARLEAERLAAAEASIAADPRVRQLLEDFEGSVLEGSVTLSSERR